MTYANSTEAHFTTERPAVTVILLRKLSLAVAFHTPTGILPDVIPVALLHVLKRKHLHLAAALKNG